MISRFYFNISIYENFKNFFKILFFKNHECENDLKKKLSILHKYSDFYFFDHGRTAFYEILNQLGKKTNKKKILINSFTLFEIINVIIYCGFEPIFIDNKKNSFHTNIKLDNFSSNLDDIAAIVITHLNGINLDVINLKKQITDHNTSNDKIFLIEDCAVAFGSQIDNKNVGTFGDYSFLSFNIMKNITSYTGGVLIDNQNKKLNSFIAEYKILSKIDIIKKIIFVFIIQVLNSKIFFPLFFKLIKYSHKYSFNFFLKKYRTDFEVRIENKFPLKFSSLMHPFQKKILLKQFNNFKENQILRTKKSKLYYDNLKEINSLDFPQDQFDKKNIFLEFPIICKSTAIKNNLFQYLMDRKIDIKNYYYKNCSEEKIYNKTSNLCLNSKHISDNILMLPVHKKIHEKYQHRIINEIKNFFAKEN
jgi:dTDP-4-amino-4,6-dideoxygalactose transaminase|tara:strand:+ start:1620 stop:2876 length:1257 start_codon:yes stop_codon:yes gene_type:complete